MQIDYHLSIIISILLFAWSFVGQAIYFDAVERLFEREVQDRGYRAASRRKPSALHKTSMGVIASCAGPLMFVYHRKKLKS